MNAIVKTTAGKLHSASVPTCLGAGSDPGNVLSPITAYTEAIARNACAAPASSMIQPMRLPARRTMSAPSVAKAATSMRPAASPALVRISLKPNNPIQTASR